MAESELFKIFEKLGYSEDLWGKQMVHIEDQYYGKGPFEPEYARNGDWYGRFDLNSATLQHRSSRNQTSDKNHCFASCLFHSWQEGQMHSDMELPWLGPCITNLIIHSNLKVKIRPSRLPLDLFNMSGPYLCSDEML